MLSRNRSRRGPARKGETMTAAIATYAYDHIDQARTELEYPAEMPKQSDESRRVEDPRRVRGREIL